MTLYDDVKRWWQSRTVWIGTVLVMLGAIVEYLAASSSEWKGYFGEWGGLAAVVIGTLNILLRLATTKPIGKAPKVRSL